MKNRKLNFLILLLFTSLVLYFTLKDNFGEVMGYILTMKPIWFVYSILLMMAYWFFKALITTKYVRYYNDDYPFRKAYRLQLETMFFNGVTPFSSGGGPFQVLSLKKDGVRILNSANIMVISSFLHQLSLFFFMTVSVIANRFLKLYAESITIRNLCIFGYIICIIFMAFLLLIMFNEKFNKAIVKIVIKILNKAHIVKNKDEVKKKWLDYVDSLNEGSKIIRSNRRDFIICAFYNIVAMLAYILVAYTVAIGMGINIEVYKVIITTSYVLMIGMFVPIPGGTGGLEYSFANMYANFINGGILGSFMLVWRFITYYVGIVLGGIVLNFKKSSK
nr:flippase-like domain-containing protein [Bacilli bacterium]